MFPCGHAYFSILTNEPTDPIQLVGALVPDAAITGTFSWAELHEPGRVDDFERHAGPGFESAITGIRHHLALDARAHDDWINGDGYAYAKQTPELRATVGRACGVGEERARVLAHNFLEAACDIHLLSVRPRTQQTLAKALDEAETEPLSAAIAGWLCKDADETGRRIDDALRVWTDNDLATVGGMVNVWREVHALLSDASEEAFGRFDGAAAADAIDQALEITASDFLAVLTP